MTTQHTLHITFDAHEAALLRLMGLVHRRGFDIEGVEMSSGQGFSRHVTLTLAPKAPNFRVDVLKRQIERLQEVREVRIEAARKPRKILSFFGVKAPASDTVARI